MLQLLLLIFALLEGYNNIQMARVQGSNMKSNDESALKSIV